MSVNDNSTDVQFSSVRGNLTSSSKSNPCPVCGRTKDGDCRISRDRRLVLCYQNFNHTKTQQPDLWHFNGETSDARCGEYVLNEKTEKSIRPKQTRFWEYPARDGSRLVRVRRDDDGEGNKKIRQERWDKKQKRWLPGYGNDEDVNKVARASIPVYRYAEVRKAIANGETIFAVEGEPCADLLWKLGLAATTNIGGGGKFTLTDSLDLRDAKVIVIVPDRDKKGIEHADKLAEYFPGAMWLYPFPESRAWENLPEKGGLDIFDWIEHEKLSASQIRAAIGEKKILKVLTPQASNVVTHSRFKPPSVDLRQEITALVNAGTTGSELTAALLELSRGSNAQQVERIYKEILEEADREEQRLDRKADVEKLLEISSRRLTLEKYLHPNLAEPIKKVSAWMGVDAEAVLTHLLPIAAGLINPNSRIVVKKCTNFVEPCLLYSAVIAETGSRKTPLLNIPKAPLVKLQAEEDARYKAELDVYKKELDAYNHRPKENKDDEPPVPPHSPREFYVDNITVESLDEIKGFQPDKAFTMIKDELSGLFASHGAYKGGRGSDKESFLSGWGGGGVKKNRCSKDSRVSLTRDSLSITGGIQPDKLRALFGDFTDAQGEWARFLWYQMPMRPYKIPRHDVAYSLGDLLESIYRKLDSLPELEFYFSKDGQNFYDDWYDKRYEQTRNETKPGLKAAMAKMPGQAARLIGVLHVLNGVSSQPPEVQEEISLTTVRAGCDLAQFYLGQVTMLQGDGDALHGELTPVLKSLLDKVNEKGKLTAAEAKTSVWGLRSDKVATNEKIRQYFCELAAMDLAEVQGTGCRLTLISKVLRNIDEVLRNPQQHQQAQNLDNTRVSEKSDFEGLRSIDEKLREPQQPETLIQQEIQQTNTPTIEEIDATQFFDTDTQPPKFEPATDEVEISVEESEITQKTSISSILGESEPQTLTQQEKIDIEESSILSSIIEDSSILSSIVEKFAKQIRKAIVNFDRPLAVEITKALQGKAKAKLRNEVKNALAPGESKNLKLLAKAGFLQGTRVKYVGDPKYTEQYEGLELEVYSMDEYFQIACLKPDGSLTTWLKPQELEIIS
jgi:CRISPR-associated protein Cmr3